MKLHIFALFLLTLIGVSHVKAGPVEDVFDEKIQKSKAAEKFNLLCVDGSADSDQLYLNTQTNSNFVSGISMPDMTTIVIFPGKVIEIEAGHFKILSTVGDLVAEVFNSQGKTDTSSAPYAMVEGEDSNKLVRLSCSYL